MIRIILFLLLSIATATTTTSTLGCLDENGSGVDSWTAIKASNSYVYYTYSKDGATWVESKYTLDQDDFGCIMQTVGQLYGKTSVLVTKETPVLVGVYNDEPPDG